MLKKTIVNKLNVEVYEDRDALGQAASRSVALKIRELIDEKGSVRIVFASSPSQREFFKYMCREKDINWEYITAFHLDEYIGYSLTHEFSITRYVKENLFDVVMPGKVFYLNAESIDIDSECVRYGELLNSIPIDIACIGIGENGHIAFNEPHEADFNDPLAVKKISIDETCRNQQFRDFGFPSLEMIPDYGVTMTIPAIMGVATLYCMVPTLTKALAIRNTLLESISETCPATILRKHENATLFLDKESSSEIGSLF